MIFKMLIIWLIGGLLLAAGAWTAGNVGYLTDDPLFYTLYIAVSVILILLAGLAWISVATAASKQA